MGKDIVCMHVNKKTILLKRARYPTIVDKRDAIPAGYDWRCVQIVFTKVSWGWRSIWTFKPKFVPASSPSIVDPSV